MEDRIYKVHHIGKKNGHYAHYESDLIFEDGQPHIVLEWAILPDGEVPSKRVKLDAEHLHRLDNWEGVDYLYGMPVKIDLLTEDGPENPETIA